MSLSRWLGEKDKSNLIRSEYIIIDEEQRKHHIKSCLLPWLCSVSGFSVDYGSKYLGLLTWKISAQTETEILCVELKRPILFFTCCLSLSKYWAIYTGDLIATNSSLRLTLVITLHPT